MTNDLSPICPKKSWRSMTKTSNEAELFKGKYVKNFAMECKDPSTLSKCDFELQKLVIIFLQIPSNAQRHSKTVSKAVVMKYDSTFSQLH